MSLSSCPSCGAKASVINSRPTKHQVYRRYECSEGHRYSTLEIEWDVRHGHAGERLRAAANSAKRLQDAADALRKLASNLAPAQKR